jgi:PDDEXK-like domain of unknown function (DUF3799)
MSAPFRLRDPKDGRLHFSLAKQVAESAATAKHSCLFPKEPTPVMEFGSIVDALLMPRPTRTVVVYPGKVRNGKAWDEFEAENAGNIITLRRDYERAMMCADAIRNDEVVRDLGLMHGEQQRVIQWEMYDLPWASGIDGDRGGLDLLGNDWIADVKVTPSVQPKRWSNQARRMLYPEQLAAYRMAASSIGRHIKNCYLIGVAAQAPHLVTVIRIPDHDLTEAERTLYAWCERIRQCEAADRWPGYVQTAVDLEPKDAWSAMFDEEDPT